MKSIQNDIKHIRQYLADIKRVGSLDANQEIALSNIEYRLRSIESELQTIEMYNNGELDCLYSSQEYQQYLENCANAEYPEQ